LTEVNLLGSSARLAPVELNERQLVTLAARLSGVKYLQSSKLLTVRLPEWQLESPTRATEILDFTAKLLAEIDSIQREAGTSVGLNTASNQG
jgi:hypothetical protein